MTGAAGNKVSEGKVRMIVTTPECCTRSFSAKYCLNQRKSFFADDRFKCRVAVGLPFPDDKLSGIERILQHCVKGLGTERFSLLGP